MLTWEPSRYGTANHYPGKGIDRRTEAVKRDFRTKSSLSDPRIAKFLVTIQKHLAGEVDALEARIAAGKRYRVLSMRL